MARGGDGAPVPVDGARIAWETLVSMTSPTGLRRWGAVASLTLGSVGCGVAPSAGACEDAHEHLRALSKEEGSAAGGDFIDQIFDERRPTYVAQCQSRMTRKQAACVVGASDIAAAEACSPEVDRRPAGERPGADDCEAYMAHFRKLQRPSGKPLDEKGEKLWADIVRRRERACREHMLKSEVACNLAATSARETPACENTAR